ncbi:hypothetical protein ACR2XN_28285, partial [Klebsiella pneumoniae]
KPTATDFTPGHISSANFGTSRSIIDQSVGIGYDYSESKGKKHVTFPKSILPVRKDVPHILKEVVKPMFSKVITEPFDESLLIIKQQLLVEDKEKEVEEKLESPSKSVTAKTELGKYSGKKNRSRNGKVDAYKKIDRSSVFSLRFSETCPVRP